MDQIDEAGDQEAQTAAVNDESSVSTSITTTSESQNCFVTNNDDGMNNVDLTAPVSCTACHHQINIKKPGSVHRHPVLEVLLCKACFKWYNSGSIDQGSDGMDEQCRWCGQGGKLVLCDFCHNAFCKDCVRKNLGRQELSKITAENVKWHCYVCNPAPLKDLVARCTRLQDALKRCASEILQSDNLTSDTDSDSSGSQGARVDGECFFTNTNVDSLADELFSESSMWVKKLATLRNGLKNRGSSRGRQNRDDLARKIYQHFKGLENCLSKIKVKGRKVKDAEKKNVTKLKRGRRKKENDIQVLDISLSGSDLELDSKDKNENKLQDERCLSDEESLPNCDGNVDCNNARDAGDTAIQTAEGLTDVQGAVAENRVSTVDCSSENRGIRLKISLPKLNTADLEAQRELHLEGLKSRSRSDSEDEEDEDAKPKARRRTKARLAAKARKTNSEKDSSEEDEEEEPEEIESSTSSEEEYNPKNDIREMKSEMRHQRREHLQKMKTKAAKRSLKKIRETIQKKKERSKEAEDDDVDDSDRETKKEERKDKKKESKRNSPTKQNVEKDSPRKSERSTKVKKTKEEEKEEEEEEEKEAKGAKETKKKSKSNAKLSGEAMNENKDASNAEDDAVKESGKTDGKNKKKQKVGHKSTSDGEKATKCDKDEDEDTKVTKKENSKKLRSAKAKKEDAVAADGDDGDRKGSEFDGLDEEIKRLEKMPKPKSNSKSSAVSKLAEKMDTNEATDEESEEKKSENKKEGSCDNELFSEDETGIVENEVEERECENKKKATRVDELFSDEGEGAIGNDDMEEKESDQSSEENGIADVGPIDLDDNDDEDDDAKARKALVDDSDEEISSGNETEIGDDEDDEDESMNKKGKKKAKGSNSACKLDDSESEADGKVKKKQSKINLPDISISDSEDDFESKNTRGKKKKRKTGEDSTNESDEDCVITKKRGRRKRKNSSSKSEASDSDSSSKKKKKRKRRRIKSSSSTENENEGTEGSADEFQSSQGKKRKKIHKILGDKKLSKQTLDAAKAEEERRQRISERQKLFNKIAAEDVDSPTKCPIAKKLILEVNEETEEPIIEVHKKLISKLKPHQVEAVQFMWNCCVETLERLKAEEGSGCILAHCMGLGKTLSVITFVHTLLRFKKLTKMKTCLVLCPLNTILNWDSEFDRWLTDITSLDVYELSTVKDNWGRSEVVKNWQEGGGVLIMGYDMFRTLSQLSRVKNKKQKKVFTEGLLNPGPDIVVCDEGHILKNDVTGLSKACNQIKTKRRVVLTGTPLQNNLIEYHCMVNFVKPNLLGTRKEFLNRFVNPMTNGQCSDSTLHDVKIMKRRAHILHETLAGCVQRKDYSALTKYLLPKHEYVVLIRLSKVQIELYEKYLQKLGEDVSMQTVRGSRIFSDYQNLMKIWTHPWVLKLDEIRQETKKIYKDDEDSFIDDSECESEMSFNSKSSKSGGEPDVAEEDDWRPKRVTRGAAKKQKEETAKEKATLANGTKDKQADDDEKEEEIVKGWKTRSRGGDGSAVENEEPAVDNSDGEGNRVSSEWWADYLKPSDQFNLEISGKLMLLAEILKMSESIGDKVLVFSQSLLSLDLIENFLAHWDKMVTVDSDKQVAGAQGWDKGVDYIRMDGSTSAQNRKEWTAMFNDEENVKARLFLISTKAGSLGINLVAANRVIIFDASWNPTHDVQSIFRVYRFGQTKPVYVYRFVAQGTMEEKIYERQVTKQSLSQRVIDEHQIERHFTAADLKELYVFKPDRIDDPNRPERPTPKLPKDRMLAELLTNHKDLIVQYHEHDSLLENKVEEELSEEERKAAWEEYEQEKKGLRPPPTSYQYNNMAAAAMMQNLYNQPSTFPMSSYIPDAHKIAQAIYASNPGISEVELKQRVQYYLQMQLVNQQRAFLAQQQKQEAEKLQRMQEERYRQQMMIAQQLGYGSSRSDAPGGVTAAEMSLLTPNLLTALTSSQSVQPSKAKGSGGQSSSK